MGRHKYEDAAAGLEHSRKLSQGGSVIVEVFQHVEGCHQVKSVRGEWELKDVRVLDVYQSAPPAELQSLFRNVDPAGGS